MTPPTETDRIFQQVQAAANNSDAHEVARLFMNYEEGRELLSFPCDYMDWALRTHEDYETSWAVVARTFGLLK
jgi:hypothetical protein